MFAEILPSLSRNRETIINEMNHRLCCPLSFCGSLEHTTVQECNHPFKMVYIEPKHTGILKNVSERILTIDENNREQVIAELIQEIKQEYFEGEEPIDEEQMHILLFRLKVPTLLYWDATYEERIQLVLEAYKRIIYRFIEPIVIEENVFDVAINEPNEEDDEDLFNLVVDLNGAFENEQFLIFNDEELFLDILNDFEPPFTEPIPLTQKGEPPNDSYKLQQCCICLDKEGCYIELNCNHTFCECIAIYLKKQKQTANCPFCREKIKELNIYFPLTKEYVMEILD